MTASTSFSPIDSRLLSKYNVPVPRYTSYPTVPYWQPEAPLASEWMERVRRTLAQNSALSLYVHLPYCENLCTYCGCNTRITKRHSVEQPYIDAVLKEWSMYREALLGAASVQELHLGGGTPTFFAASNLRQLVSRLLEGINIAKDREFSFEAHPSSTSKEHLQALHEVGFNRLSIGVQDFGEEILAIINRRQTQEQVYDVTKWAREIGYESVNFDLIFGLPLQTLSHIDTNMDRVDELRPDRIAFYSYAHVPWVKPGQRAYSEEDLPSETQKRALYEHGKKRLLDMGYVEIGMDHFALPTDSLCKAYRNGSMHRNFMGYTTAHTELLVGLGTSAISDCWTGFIQNEKNVEAYMSRIESGRLPFFRGHLLTEEDEVIRKHISNIMCQLATSWEAKERQHPALFEGLARMEEFVKDGLIELRDFSLEVTPKGQPFLRNICSALDARLWGKKLQGQVFSQGV